ncbi:MAG: hypothetical protein JSS83_15615 [Cyanobacteria bacterium SZAS LIN-3]|nr:hypothetical protein [Cyanobacteria bacterium SZAS LIN-3]
MQSSRDTLRLTGLLLFLSILGFAASVAEDVLTSHHVAALSAAVLCLVAMCGLAERFDGGMPRFYEDLHRSDRHS